MQSQREAHRLSVDLYDRLRQRRRRVQLGKGPQVVQTHLHGGISRHPLQPQQEIVGLRPVEAGHVGRAEDAQAPAPEADQRRPGGGAAGRVAELQAQGLALAVAVHPQGDRLGAAQVEGLGKSSAGRAPSAALAGVGGREHRAASANPGRLRRGDEARADPGARGPVGAERDVRPGVEPLGAVRFAPPVGRRIVKAFEGQGRGVVVIGRGHVAEAAGNLHAQVAGHRQIVLHRPHVLLAVEGLDIPRLFVRGAVELPAVTIAQQLEILARLAKLRLDLLGEAVGQPGLFVATDHFHHLPGTGVLLHGHLRGLDGDRALQADRLRADVFDLVGADVVEHVVPAHVGAGEVGGHAPHGGKPLVEIGLEIAVAVGRGAARYDVPHEVRAGAVAGLVEHVFLELAVVPQVQLVEIVPAIQVGILDAVAGVEVDHVEIALVEHGGEVAGELVGQGAVGIDEEESPHRQQALDLGPGRMRSGLGAQRAALAAHEARRRSGFHVLVADDLVADPQVETGEGVAAGPVGRKRGRARQRERGRFLVHRFGQRRARHAGQAGVGPGSDVGIVGRDRGPEHVHPRPQPRRMDLLHRPFQAGQPVGEVLRVDLKMPVIGQPVTLEQDDRAEMADLGILDHLVRIALRRVDHEQVRPPDRLGIPGPLAFEHRAGQAVGPFRLHDRRLELVPRRRDQGESGSRHAVFPRAVGGKTGNVAAMGGELLPDVGRRSQETRAELVVVGGVEGPGDRLEPLEGKPQAELFDVARLHADDLQEHVPLADGDPQRGPQIGIEKPRLEQVAFAGQAADGRGHAPANQVQDGERHFAGRVVFARRLAAELAEHALGRDRQTQHVGFHRDVVAGGGRLRKNDRLDRHVVHLDALPGRHAKGQRRAEVAVDRRMIETSDRLPVLPAAGGLRHALAADRSRLEVLVERKRDGPAPHPGGDPVPLPRLQALAHLVQVRGAAVGPSNAEKALAAVGCRLSRLGPAGGQLSRIGRVGRPRHRDLRRGRQFPAIYPPVRSGAGLGPRLETAVLHNGLVLS